MLFVHSHSIIFLMQGKIVVIAIVGGISFSLMSVPMHFHDHYRTWLYNTAAVRIVTRAILLIVSGGRGSARHR